MGLYESLKQFSHHMTYVVTVGHLTNRKPFVIISFHSVVHNNGKTTPSLISL